jgi:hypothetical protein
VKSSTLILLEPQAPSLGLKSSALLRDAATASPLLRDGATDAPGAFSPRQHTGHVIKAPHIANAEAGNLNTASARLDLLAAEAQADARLFRRCNLPADSERCQLEADGLKLAAEYLRQLWRDVRRLLPEEPIAHPQTCEIIGWRPALPPSPPADNFAFACAVLRARADDLAGQALDALKAGFTCRPFDAAGHRAEGSALRYAAAVLATERPATAAELAA